MRVRFEGGPLDGTMRELPDRSDAFYVQRTLNVDVFAADVSPLAALQAQTIEYRPAYVVFVPAAELAPVSARNNGKGTDAG